MTPGWIDLSLRIIGAIALISGPVLWVLGRGRKQAGATISKTEREANKFQAEKYLVELNVNDIIEKKAQLIEEKYKDIIFNMQREHFEIKKDIQGRLEKEMKSRIEAEQENEILKNELHLIKAKSENQDEQIEYLKTEVNKLKNKK